MRLVRRTIKYRKTESACCQKKNLFEVRPGVLKWWELKNHETTLGLLLLLNNLSHEAMMNKFYAIGFYTIGFYAIGFYAIQTYEGVSVIITHCEPLPSNQTTKLHSKSFFNLFKTNILFQKTFFFVAVALKMVFSFE